MTVAWLTQGTIETVSVDIDHQTEVTYQIIVPKEAGSFEEWLNSVNAHRQLTGQPLRDGTSDREGDAH